MTDLQSLLDHSVDHHVDLDVGADLRRGRSAVRRRRAAVGAGVTAAVLALGGTATGLARSSLLPLQPSHTVVATVHAGAFEIPPPPDGWSVQAAGTSLVVIAPDGLPKVDLSDPALNFSVMGKLLIHLMDSSEQLKSGTTIDYRGRTFYDIESDPKVHQVSVRESSGDWLVLQEAPRLSWTLQQMVQYLDAVVVGPGATPDTG